MKHVKAMVPALLVVAAYVLLAGWNQGKELRGLHQRRAALGEINALQEQAEGLKRERNRLQSELRVEKEARAKERAGRLERLPSTALTETYRRMTSRAGTRILGAFQERDAQERGSEGGAMMRPLLCGVGGRAVRSWTVSVEAPWSSMRAILEDFAAMPPESSLVVETLSMRPGVGPGKPSCWSLTICQ